MSLLKVSFYTLFAFLMLSCLQEEEVYTPTLASITPTRAERGAEVVIEGEHFGLSPKVYFNGAEASFAKTATETSLTVLVPEGASTGKITVKTDDRVVESSEDFVLLTPPYVDAFEPVHGGINTFIKITGTNFTQDLVAKIGDHKLTIIGITATEIRATVPIGSATGKISVTTDEGTGSSVRDFGFDTQVISAVQYHDLPHVVTVSGPGQVLDIHGKNFSEIIEENIVTINDVAVVVTQAQPQRLVVTLPEGVATGKVVVRIGANRAESEATLTIPPGYFTQKGDFPGTARQLASVFSTGTTAFLGLGVSAGNQYLNDCWQYDAATDTWTRVANFPGTGRRAAASFTVGNHGYVGPGIAPDGGGQQDFWEYDVQADFWTRRADVPNAYKAEGIGFSIQGKGYIGLGSDGQLWEYNPTGDSWQRKADFPGERRTGAAVFVLQNKAYVAAGTTDYITGLQDFWEYDPAQDRWTRLADYPVVNSFGGYGVSVQGKGYVGAGSAGSTVWGYDPVSATWEAAVPFLGNYAPYNAHFVVNDKAYIGISGAFGQGDLWQFTAQ